MNSQVNVWQEVNQGEVAWSPASMSKHSKTSKKTMSQRFNFNYETTDQSVERRALGHEVVGSNLPAVPKVTLGGHSSGSLTIPRCKNGTRSWPGQSELTLRMHYTQVIERAGNGASILALTSMGGVNQSLKQRIPVVPQNAEIVTAKN